MHEETSNMDELAGIHSIDHFGLVVPDLRIATEFFWAFGLDVVEIPGSNLELRAGGAQRCWARIFPGWSRTLGYIAFRCFPEDFERICAQVVRAGGTPATPFPEAPPDGYWFRDIVGNLVQLRQGPIDAPVKLDRGVVSTALQRDAVARNVLIRSDIREVQPLRLSHVMLFVPQMEAVMAFYVQALGMRITDSADGLVGYMHTRHGSDHHIVAFAASSATGWHHSSWEVPDMDDVGSGATQMRAAGFCDGWGVGRHILGSNYFYYARDPWGSFCEYAAHIDYIPAGADWKERTHARDEILYIWGPDSPSDFTVNSEA